MDDIRPPRLRGLLQRPQRPVPPRAPVPPQAPQTPPMPAPIPRQTSQSIPASSQPPALPRPPLPSAPAPLRLGKRRWPWIVAIVLFVLIVAGIAVAGFWWYNASIQPLSTVQRRVRVVVSPGDTADTIGKKLQDAGAIKSAAAFSIYAKQSGKLGNNLKAGNYLFSPTESVAEIVNLLVEGKVDSYNVTILPGQTLAQIKDKLVRDGFGAPQIDAAFAKTYDNPLLKDKPATVSLEGYIYPETYAVTSETTVEELLGQTFDVFYARIQQKNLLPNLQAHGFSLHQGLTLASVVQMEVSTASDRRQVAQVFESRLQQGMALGSDVTAYYAAKLLKQPPNVDADSPYNTRKYKGLPPGPIANFTLDSLAAIADPAPGDYLFFVAGDDGKTHFAHTEAEHQQNVKNYCSKLCN
jgi:UPF0755 protein